MATSERSHDTDLLIRINRWNDVGQCYPVEAWVNSDLHFPGGELRLDLDALLVAEDDPEAYGLALFYALFAGPIREAYDRATGYAETSTHGRLRIRLWIDHRARDLHVLAWERLHHLQRNLPAPMTTVAQMPFSRYTGLDIAQAVPITARPIRMLIAISNPKDLVDEGLAAIDLESEIASLMAALGNLRATEQLAVTVLPGATPLNDDLRARLERDGYTVHTGTTDLDTITRLLSTDGGFHILHFLGHGYYDGRRRANFLLLEDTDGFIQTARDKEIAGRLRDIPAPPHLVFLAACESATRDTRRGNPFVGLAPRLVEAGIPAVIAMQDQVPITTARELSHNFYTYLLEHGIVDRALSQARLLLYEQKAPAWAIPTLYMRLENGQLFAADPVRNALRAMLLSETFNPLPAGGAYLPLEAYHMPGRSANIDFDILSLQRTPGRAMTDAVLDIFSTLKQEPGPYGPSTLAIVGGAGMGKSVEMRHIGQVTAQQSLAEDATRIVIPVYIDLQTLAQGTRIDATTIETLILENLTAFWASGPGQPPASQQQPAGILEAYTGPILRVIIDGTESLPYHSRRRLCAALQHFIRSHARHEYIVAFNTDSFETAPLTFTDTLVMLPLSERNIRRYLTHTLNDDTGLRLIEAIERTRLFDLAAIPWLLFKMLGQTRAGNPPQSHAQVLQDLVEDAVADVATDQGMRTRAAKTLYALAWRMQSTFTHTLTIDEAFKIMADVRGHRGYSLENLYRELTFQGLLSPVGEESLRFTRSAIRAYCCARAILEQPDVTRTLDDITATLGRYTRYAWWEETLTLLSGLMDNPTPLIQKILYGVALGEGEQVFLAANCLQECRQQCIDEQLITYVVNALLWRLDSTREPRVARRVRIIEALGHLRHPVVTGRLIEIACEKTRITPRYKLRYEYSSVRLAAITALRQMLAPPYRDIEDRAPHLVKLLNYWANEQVEALIPYLIIKEGQEAAIQPIAAFALGSLQTGRAQDVIIRMFLSPHINQETRRNLVIALTLLAPATVTDSVILPLLDGEPAQPRSIDAMPDTSRAIWYPHLAYLIGKIRFHDNRARAFLYRCLNEIPDVELKGIAIQSIGWLYDTAAKGRITDVALGHFDSLNLPAPPSAEQAVYLQQKALDALYYIGDVETVKLLQARATGWLPELEIAFYRTIERILSRQRQQ